VYRYEEQPQTNFVCNPYSNNELRLVCRVEGPQLRIIRWFWKPSSTQQPQELSGPSRPRPSDKYSITMSTTVSQGQRSRLVVFRLSDSDVGRYFCRPELVNSTLLTPSDELILNVQSTYTVSAACSFGPFITTTTSCASIVTDDTVTVQPTTGTTGNTGNTEFETTNSATTDASSGPTDPPYPDNTPDNTPAPTPTTIPMAPEPESSTLQVALYIVVAVIVVICAMIVTLAITIVILYCKKCGPKKTAGMSVLAF